MYDFERQFRKEREERLTMFWLKTAAFLTYVRDNVIVCGAAYIVWHFVGKCW